MPRFLRLTSWWQPLVGGLLVFAEIHYFAFPLMRSYEMRTQSMEWLNSVFQLMFLVGGCWMIWSSTEAMRGGSRSGSYLRLAVFVAACGLKHLKFQIDPLYDSVSSLGYSVLNIGSLPGQGWEWATPPVPQQVGWWVVHYAAFGLECVLVAAVARRLVLYLRSRSIGASGS